MFRIWPRWPWLEPNRMLGFFVWGLGLFPWVLGAVESDSVSGAQREGIPAEQDSVVVYDVRKRLEEVVHGGGIWVDSLTVLGSRHVADGFRWAGGVWTDSYMLWGRPVSLELGGRRGHRLRVAVDGWEVPNWDPGGEDLHRISLEEIRSLRLDRVRGRICVRTTDEHGGRPRTVVGRQVGSRQLTYSGLTFERPLRSGVQVYVAGHRGQAVDRGSHRGFSQEVGKIALDGRSRDGRWRMRFSVLRGISSRDVPGPYVVPLERTLRDRWMRWAMALDRTVGRRGGVCVRGQIDGLRRRLRRPDVGRDVDRSDVDGGVRVEGALLWSEGHAVQGRLGGRWRTFEDTEGAGREDRRRTLSVEMEAVLGVGGTALRSWGVLRYDSKFGMMGSGGVQVDGPDHRSGSVSMGVGWTSRPPTFDEVYWEGYDVADSMHALSLQEEHGLRGWIGGRYRIGGVTLRSLGFAERSWDRMGAVGMGSDGRYANLPRTVEGGCDVGVSAELGAHIGVEGAYTYRSTRTQGKGTLPYVPTHRGKAWIWWRQSYFREELEPGLSAGVEYVGARWGYEPGGARVLLDEVLFVQVRLEARILTDVQTFYQVDNLLDVTYEARPGYRAEGRSFRWGLRWTLWD